jgi:protein-L-isoaspartate(D-aspartate) O-methyltransferase
VNRSVELRRRLVGILERNGSLRTPAVRAAFLAVGREIFVPKMAEEHGLDYVYADEALVTRKRDGMPTSSSSQPSIMALMLEALDVSPGRRVLEIGLGTGYNAALLRTLVGPTGTVTSVDIAQDVVDDAEAALAEAGLRVETVCGDGNDGYAASSPYDRIIATASTDHVPQAWWAQLAPDGIVVAPLRFGAMQLVVVLARTATGFVATTVIPGGFMPMRAAADAPSSAGVTITVEENLGDGTSSSLSISGPGLGTLSPDARAAAVGYILATPRRLPVAAGADYPIRALIWQSVMSTPIDRQLVVYDYGISTRYGTVGPDGAAAFIRVQMMSDAALEEVELCGPADALGAQLATVAPDWHDAGRPSLDRLSLAIDYDACVPAPEWALATSEHQGQRWCLGWA